MSLNPNIRAATKSRGGAHYISGILILGTTVHVIGLNPIPISGLAQAIARRKTVCCKRYGPVIKTGPCGRSVGMMNFFVFKKNSTIGRIDINIGPIQWLSSIDVKFISQSWFVQYIL